MAAILLIAYNRSAGVLGDFDIDELTANSDTGVLEAVAGKLWDGSNDKLPALHIPCNSLSLSVGER